MSLKSKKIQKELMFFSFENVNSYVIDDLIRFCSNQENLLISDIKIEFEKNQPHRISIGINFGGVVSNLVLNKNIFYYFKSNNIKGVDCIDDIDWW